MPGMITHTLSGQGWSLPLESDTRENAVTRAFHDAMWPTIIDTIVRSLLAGAPHAQVQNILSRPYYVFLPRRTPCPDMVILDADDNVLCVLEFKINAPANPTSVLIAARDGYLEDATETDLALEYEDLHAHDWDHCACGSGQLVKNQGGLHLPAIWQIDCYRFTRGWLQQNGLTIVKPADVLWVLVDLRGRAARDVFRLHGPRHPLPLTAHSADQWHTTSYAALVPALLTALPMLPRHAPDSQENIIFLGLLGKLSAVAVRNGLAPLA